MAHAPTSEPSTSNIQHHAEELWKAGGSFFDSAQHPTSNIQHPTSNIQMEVCAFGGEEGGQDGAWRSQAQARLRNFDFAEGAF